MTPSGGVGAWLSTFWTRYEGRPLATIVVVAQIV
jgi:hypothetical protein